MAAMLFPSEEERAAWAAVIRLGAQVATKAELAAVLELGKKAKPVGFDAVVVGMAERYRGDQESIVRQKLSQRYPNAGEMPISPVNWLAFFARSDAGVYVVDATRRLQQGRTVLPSQDQLDADGAVVVEADPRAAGFARAVEDIGLAQLMPELERRVLTGVKSAVVELGYRRLGVADEGRPVAHMYWPSDAVVVCHHSAPSDERAAFIVGLRQTPTSSMHGVGEDGKPVETWLVWSREFTEDADGNVETWGPWGYCTISSDGKHQTLRREYPGGRLPIAFLRIEQADGGFWPAPERDVIAQVDELNVGRSNEQHTVDLQGHGQVVYSGTFQEGDEIVSGPDRWSRIGPNETATVLDFNPKLADMRSSRQESLREIAVSRSNNPDAYATTPSVAQSGISRAIANIPHDRRIRELRPIFRRFEEQHLLPILIDVLNTFAPPTYCPTIGDDVVARVVFGPPPDYEELDQKQRRTEIDLKMGIISPARYAVLNGYYDNEDAAAADGLSTELAPRDTPTPSTAGTPTPAPAPAPAPVVVDSGTSADDTGQIG